MSPTARYLLLVFDGNEHSSGAEELLQVVVVVGDYAVLHQPRECCREVEVLPAQVRDERGKVSHARPCSSSNDQQEMQALRLHATEHRKPVQRTMGGLADKEAGQQEREEEEQQQQQSIEIQHTCFQLPQLHQRGLTGRQLEAHLDRKRSARHHVSGDGVQ